jgi:predicted Zn finger-like uncharacterized protein
VQIACPNCSTSYVLDERLLPAAGAPVQCTRCAHVFTAKPGAPSAKDASGTQIFGMATPGAPKAAEPPKPAASTQVFGKPLAPASASPQKRPSGTQVFGKPIVPAQAAPAEPSTPFDPPPKPFDPKATQAFGRPLAPQGDVPSDLRPTLPAEAFTSGGFPVRRGTQVFGAPLVPPAASPPPKVDPTPAKGTPVFGGGPLSINGTEVTLISAHKKQVPMEITTPASVPPESRDAPAAMDPRQTQMFGYSALATEPIAAPHDAELPTPPVSTPVDPRLMAGTQPGTPPVHTRSDDTTERAATPQPRRLVTPIETQPHPVQLPAEVADVLSALTRQRPEQQGYREELSDPGAQVRASIQRRNGMAVTVLVLAVLGAGGFFGYRKWTQRTPAIPAQARLTLDHAVSLLKRDDPTSLRDAAALFKQLAQTYPSYLEARADLLVTLAFELDDAQWEISRIEAQSAELNAKVAKLQQAKATSDWQNRVNAMIDDLELLKKRTDPINQKTRALTEEVNHAVEAMQPTAEPSTEEQKAITRATALYMGVTGRDQVYYVVERYKTLGGADGWEAIALAEYAVNSRATPEQRLAAARAIEDVRRREASMIRAHVLAARLALADKHSDAAISALEAAYALNPNHELAKSIQSELQR